MSDTATPRSRLCQALRLTLRARADVRVAKVCAVVQCLTPDDRQQWNAYAIDNGWTVLFALMAELEQAHFAGGGQVDVVRGVLDAGIAATQALAAFVAQTTAPAVFTSANAHHQQLFQLLMERTGKLQDSSAILRSCVTRCRDPIWLAAIQRARNRTSPGLEAQIAAAVSSRKRQAPAAQEEEEEQGEQDDEDCDDQGGSGSDGNVLSAEDRGRDRKGCSPRKRVRVKRDASPVRTTEELMRELESLIGMEAVVQQVKRVIRDQEVRRARARDPHPLPNSPSTLHLVFSGPPGTCKTIVAELVAKIYQSLGILSKGTYRKVKTEDFQGRYLGQTEATTKKILESCIGGVLFIDEIYKLAGKSSYGPNVVGTMLTYLEDHRDDLVVIIAGYENRMVEFFSLNEGLARRFPAIIRFEEYTPAVLVQIFKYLSAKDQRTLTPAAEAKLLSIAQADYDRRDTIDGYGNGGDMRTILEKAISLNNARLPTPLPSPLTDEVKLMMSTLEESDIQPLLRRTKSPESSTAAAEDVYECD